jgi:hypothetical protein
MGIKIQNKDCEYSRRVLREILAPKTEEVNRRPEKVHDEELHDVYCL